MKMLKTSSAVAVDADVVRTLAFVDSPVAGDGSQLAVVGHVTAVELFVAVAVAVDAVVIKSGEYCGCTVVCSDRTNCLRMCLFRCLINKRFLKITHGRGLTQLVAISSDDEGGVASQSPSEALIKKRAG